MPRAQSPARHEVARAARPILAAAEVVTRAHRGLRAASGWCRAGLRAPCRRADAIRCAGAAAGSGRPPRAPWCWQSDSVAPDAASLAPARRRSHRHEPLGIAQHLEHGRVAGRFVDRAQQRGLELRAQDGGALQRASSRRRQAVDPRQQADLRSTTAPPRCRSPARSAIRSALRVRTPFEISARTTSSRYNGIAAGLANDALVQCALDGVRGGGTEEGRELGLDRIVGERRQPQHGVRDAAEVQAAGIERRAAAQHDQQGPLAQPVRQRVQAFDRRRIGPLQVLDHQHQRPLGEAALEHRAQAS